jgi:hypothetical protein
MVDIITDSELASYLQSEVTGALTLIVTKTNELVTEAWLDPVTPVPVRVWTVAINVAARAASNPKGLTSWTRSWDDISRTERVEGGDRRFGLFLTDEDLLDLNGDQSPTSGAGTIHTPSYDRVCRRPSC